MTFVFLFFLMSKKVQTVLMSVFYFTAGIFHFIKPQFYLGIIPDFIAEKEFAVALSGLLEVIASLFLLFKETRKITSKLIIIMLLVFLFVIHFPMAFEFYQNNDSLFWFAIFRIPLQFVFIFLAYKISKIKEESKFY